MKRIRTMSNMEEWRDVPNYEGYYQVSNLGRVRSLDRVVIFADGRERLYRGSLIEGTISNKGYSLCRLSINGVVRTFYFSQLVAMTFLGHAPNGNTLVVDHINGDKSDDRVENLRIVTNRSNTSTCFRSNEESLGSGYVGVSWDKSRSKWKAQIQYEGVCLYLGLYDSEIEASNAYQEALSKVKDGSFNPDDYKPEWTSKYKGVSFNKANNKWQAYITINGKRKYLGYHPTELEACKARLKAEKEQKSA